MFKLIAIVVILSLIALAKANVDEARCALYLDDCEACLSQKGCGWCEDGFCTAIKSDFCSGEISQNKARCSAKDEAIHVTETRDQCSTLQCASCLANPACTTCVAGESGFAVCVAASGGCTTDIYSNLPLNAVTSCPSVTSGTNPSNPEFITIILPTGSPTSLGEIAALIANAFNIIINPTPQLNYGNIVIVSVVLLTKRQVSTAPEKVTFYFQNVGGLSSSTLTTEFLNAANSGAFASTLGITSATTGATTTGTTGATTTGATTSSNSGTTTGHGGSAIHMSRGALAGIIIGCVIAGMVIIAIIAFFLLRRREAYPLPFRSPAAAYRP